LDGLIKRKSGGQPRNQNARKHGFYSQALDSPEKHELKYAVGLDGLDQEIAILRVKFRSLLSYDGTNLRLINQTAETLGRLYQIKYGLSKNDSAKLKEAVASVLEEFIVPQPPADASNSGSAPVPES
jgi:hypothetical protein